jgi:regulator of protease activity HflC (stomatin/prohibitin superfamily)
MDDQFKNLTLDIDDLSDRPERRRRSGGSPMPLFVQICTGVVFAGITLFAVRMLFVTVMVEGTSTHLTNVTHQLQERAQERAQVAQEESRKRLEAYQAEKVRKKAEVEQQKQIQLAQAERERRWKTPKCQFWMLQDQQNPTDKSRANKSKYCPNI